MKALMESLIKFKRIIAETSGSGDITEKVTKPPTHNLSALVSQRLLNRFEQTWARLKAIVVSLIKFKRNMVETSGSGNITGNVVFRPALLELTFFSRR